MQATVKLQLVRTLICWVVLSGLLCFVRPSQLPVALLVLPFIGVFMVCYETWKLGASIWDAGRKSLDNVQVKRFGKFIAAFITVVVVLASLGQLVGRDVITLFLLFAIGYFYLLRSRKQAGKQ
jgi:hypothetical protein